MQIVIDDFNERVGEVERYFQFLENLDEKDACLYFPGRENDRTEQISQDIHRILKANVFLILYNLVESCIRQGILRMYEIMRDEGLVYKDLREEIRLMWIKYPFRQIDPCSATMETYQKKTLEIVKTVVDEEVIRLGLKAFMKSGNLDADRIRQICWEHGIPHDIHPGLHGGIELGVVKEQRNALAHGRLTFSEVGQNKTLNDIKEVKCQVVEYVECVLNNMKDYVERKAYKANAALSV